MKYISKFVHMVFLLGLLSVSSLASADVRVTFYSHDFGDHFPHAFFTAQGELSTGIKIGDKYGFTAMQISPAILLGSVKGRISQPTDKYTQQSMAHFTLVLNDQQYGDLMEVVNKWEMIPGKSYSLNKRNCVHFIRDALVVLGYSVNRKSKFFKKPKSFLREVKTLNPILQFPLAESP